MLDKVVKFFHKYYAYALTALLYFAAGDLGLRLATINHNVSPIWPASGIAFIAYLIFGRSIAPAIYISAILFNIKTGSTFGAAAFIAFGNTLEGLVAAHVYTKVRNKSAELSSTPEVIAIMSAILSGVVISAGVGTISLYCFDIIRNADQITNTFFTWWIGDAFGILIIGPIYSLFFVSHNKGQTSTFKSFQLKTILKLFFIIASSILYSWIIFTQENGIHLLFLTNLILLFITFFFSIRYAYFSMLSIYSVGIFIILKSGVYFLDSGNENLNFTILQILFFGASVSLLLFFEISKAQFQSNAVYVLIFSWFVGGGLVSYYNNVEDKNAKSIFVQKVDSSQDYLQQRISGYELMINYSSIIFSLEPDLSNKRWKELMTSLNLKQFPSVAGIGLVYKVPRAQLNEWSKSYEKKNSLKINLQFAKDIKNQHKLPNEAFILAAIEPYDESKFAIGLDLASEKSRYEAAILSLKTKEPTVTKKTSLILNSKITDSSIYLRPTFRNGEFIGWIYSPFIWSRLLNDSNLPSDLDYSIKFKNDESSVFTSSNFEKNMTKKLIHTEFVFGNEIVEVVWKNNQIFNSSKGIAISWISAVVSIISLLLFALVSNLTENHEKTILLVKKREDELKDSHLQLLQASKLSSLGEMAGGIAHEINNPLAIIRGRSGLIRKHLSNDSFEKDKLELSLDIIDKTVVRITKIIDGLRGLSRSPNKLEELNAIQIGKIIDDTLIFCSERFKSNGVSLEVEINENPYIAARETQISQVFLNLFNNAFDAIYDKENPWIKVIVDVEGNFATIRILDSGSGIPDEVAESIMLPFFTTKEVGKGTGLGLSISSSIIAEHNGELILDRTSKNTCFIIKIPLAKAKKLLI